ncbi:retroviral-like aspartic protease family protein [Sinomicrobium kalidii]|uniref:retropepsin-like aspartic protease family protein n=1 Tax=Sinomicrobium kalidii TaxID=2900738 RepID=UPI001E5BB285|nr:retropepsin-like aspartic protease [Sinomicrobium kalidii]UGU17572.1 retroviral-like aspartic protease family protein [Sinomicrobium kalidii]
MKSLKGFLREKGFVRVPLILTNTNHFEIKAEINGIEGRFILDTGASTTCVGTDCVDHFNLSTEDSEVKAAGAGANNMETRMSKKNSLNIGSWSKKKVKLVLFNLSHVNEALVQHDSLPVHGIIGADILKKAKAIIDYDKKCVYLKKSRNRK